MHILGIEMSLESLQEVVVLALQAPLDVLICKHLEEKCPSSIASQANYLFHVRQQFVSSFTQEGLCVELSSAACVSLTLSTAWDSCSVRLTWKVIVASWFICPPRFPAPPTSPRSAEGVWLWTAVLLTLAQDRFALSQDSSTEGAQTWPWPHWTDRLRVWCQMWEGLCVSVDDVGGASHHLAFSCSVLLIAL